MNDDNKMGDISRNTNWSRKREMADCNRGREASFINK